MAKKTGPDDAAQIVNKRMELSRDYCRPYFERFLDNYKHYFLRIIDEAVEEDPDSYPFYSQLMLPINYQIVETLMPRMFSRLPSFTIQTDQDNDEVQEMKFRELIRYQMNHPYLIDDPVFLRLATTAKEMFITGNAWGEVPWMKKEVEVEERMPICPEMGITEPSWDNYEKIKYYIQQGGNLKITWAVKKIKKNVIDAPVYEHRSIFHTWPDPKKKSISQLKYVLLDDMMTLDDIMHWVKASPDQTFQNIDELKKLKAYKITAKDGERWDDEMAAIFGSESFADKDDTKDQKQFKVVVMKEPHKLTIVVNDTVTIRESANPYGDGKLGMILAKDIPVPHELFAWGEPDPIKRIEDAMSDQVNMRNDSVFYDLLRMWKLNPNALIEGEEFIPEPGTVVQVKDMDAIQPIETGQTKQTAYREYQEWDQIIQSVSGATDYATGSSAPGMNDTKGGVELLQQAANARFQFKLQLFENLCLEAMGTMYVQRNLRFFDEPVHVNTERGKMLVTPEDILLLKGNVSFIVDSGSTEAVNTATEVNKWKTVSDLVSENKAPFHNLTEESHDKIAKRMLYSMRVNDADDLIKRNKPVVPDNSGATTVADVLGGDVVPEGGANGQPTEPVAPPIPADTAGQPTI